MCRHGYFKSILAGVTRSRHEATADLSGKKYTQLSRSFGITGRQKLQHCLARIRALNGDHCEFVSFSNFHVEIRSLLSNPGQVFLPRGIHVINKTT